MKKVLLLITFTLLCTLSFAENKNLYEVTTSKLNVREAPSPTAKVVGSYSQGDKISVLEIKGTWALTYREAGVEKWASAKYLKLIHLQEVPKESNREKSIFNIFKFIGLDVNVPEFSLLKRIGQVIKVDGRAYMIVASAILALLIFLLWNSQEDEEDSLVLNLVKTIAIVLVSIYCILYFLTSEDPTWFCDPDQVGWGYTILNFIFFFVFVAAWTFCYTLQFFTSELLFCTDVKFNHSLYALIATPVVIGIMSLFSLHKYNLIPLCLLGVFQIWQIYRVYITSYGRHRIVNTILHFIVYIITTIASFCIAGVFIPLLIIASLFVIGLSAFCTRARGQSQPSRKMTIQDYYGHPIDLVDSGHGVWRDRYGKSYIKSAGEMVRKD